VTSRRVETVKASPTLAITARALALKREGKEVVSLSVGEPDFPVFAHVEAAIVEALKKNATKYTNAAGTPELREAIAAWMERDCGFKYPTPQIVATAGAKQALFNACQALLDEGDEAVIPNPYWVSYPEMVRLAGAKPVEMMTHPQDNWEPRAEELERVMSPRTKVVMLGSPSNPTGAVWSEDSLRGIARVLAKFPKVVVLSDDIYDKLVYGSAKAVNLLRIAPELQPRTVLINGCSKAYAMTGLRLGWACGPKEIISAMNKVQDASTSNPSSLSQAAGVAALRGPQEPLEAMRVQFEKRKTKLVQLLRGVPGIDAREPSGAYYVFADVSKLLSKKLRGEPLATTQRLAEVLLEEFGVAVVPGSAFGREGYLRLSFATSEEQIDRAVSLLGKFAAALD
jgi:aspartate aminotransferase